MVDFCDLFLLVLIFIYVEVCTVYVINYVEKY